ncbi:DUF6385 domain-containing protein [Paenibacillus sinopodophylli]|uniref:DUF6385 domain-containing protein n=1 Tax=Paenibacillus sinopodophylli TaxID=1837342 RepID=UPI00110CD684|nr:DUF6385 domain-containing protein [Paenibacillus sinopodophylli]
MPKPANRCERTGRKKNPVISAKPRKSKCRRRCRRRKRKEKCTRSGFCEVVYKDLHTSDQFKPLPMQDTSNKTMYSYAIVNHGENPAVLRLEVGPNGSDYAVDMEGVVEKGMTEVVVPSKFMRYTRLTMKSKLKGQPTRLQVYFQAQLA